MSVKPISPDDAAALKTSLIPDEVITAFNELIASNLVNGTATVSQNAAITAITKRTGKKRDTIFAKGWLDIEDVYRAQGWTVEYDKPGYNEDYPASFTFRKR